MDVFVAGGTGVIGSSLCRVLADRGHRVTAASRTPDRSDVPATVDAVTVDVTEPDLTDAVAGHDAVVNLVALPSHAKPTNQSHRSVQRDGTKNLVRAAERTAVERFVLLSGLGVESGVETDYFRAKREAERIVRDASPEWVIYRPSVVFGDGCAFLPFLERVIPPSIAPLPGGGRMRLQPIWVEDLSPAIADGVENDEHAGRIFEIGGPERLTFAEVVRLVTGSEVVPIPMALSAVAFAVADYLPVVPFGRDQYRVLDVDNTTPENDVTAFGVAETDLLTLREYLETKAY